MKFYSTKIIATVGPACFNKNILKKMISVGVNAFRINTAHGSFEEYSSFVSLIKEVSPELPIIIDLKGPEVRVGLKNQVKIKKSQELSFGFSSKDEFYFNKNFYSKISVGTKILFEDAKYSAKVISKKDNKLVLKFLTNSILRNHKGVNIPSVNLGLSFLSKKDFKVIEWAKKKKLSFFALSFCRSATDLILLKKRTGSDSILIAKIESKEGVKNYSEILTACDGVIVARGDLGAEVKRETIPLLQKKLVKQAINAGKFSVVATQMLESMIENTCPTRAEINDIANSVLDGADCLMLSGETSIGNNPVTVVKEMRLACEEVEEQVPNFVKTFFRKSISDSITKTIFQLSKYLEINKIIAFTKSGFTCQMISRFRTKIPIFGLTWSKRTLKLLSLYFGVFPLLLSKKQKINSTQAIILLKRKKFLKKDETIIITGNNSQQEQHSNLIEVQKVK